MFAETTAFTSSLSQRQRSNTSGRVLIARHTPTCGLASATVLVHHQGANIPKCHTEALLLSTAAAAAAALNTPAAQSCSMEGASPAPLFLRALIARRRHHRTPSTSHTFSFALALVIICRCCHSQAVLWQYYACNSTVLCTSHALLLPRICHCVCWPAHHSL